MWQTYERRRKATGKMNALEFLNEDICQTRHFFRTIKKMTEPEQQRDKFDLVKQVCRDLLIHLRVEETIFYTALRGQIDDDAFLNEAQGAHNSLRELIHDLIRQPFAHPLFDARVTVLAEDIEHHVQKKEAELFPKVRNSPADLMLLGQRLTVASHQMHLRGDTT